MRLHHLLIPLLICACSGVAVEQDALVAAQSDNATAQVDAPVQQPVIEPGVHAADPIDFFPPSASRNLDDLVAGCQGMNPDRRPRGSNCFGIFPEQCGADRAQVHLGEAGTAALFARLQAFSPGGDMRIIRPGDAMIEDLRFGRMNVSLDQRDRIVAVDCF